jgi:hypothetical protein
MDHISECQLFALVVAVIEFDVKDDPETFLDLGLN